MSAPGMPVQEQQVALRVIPSPAPWEAYLLAVTKFPMPDEELIPARRFLQKLSAAAGQEWKLASEVGIQIVQLHLQDGPARISNHGREWIPALGLGVWPDRPPPTGWTDDDFKELGMDEKPRTLMYQVLRVTTTPEAREQARDVMLGLGSVLQVMVPDSADAFLDRARAFLLPPIQDSAFTCFPFYVPLVEAKTLRETSGGDLDQYLCGASVYIRESAEDKGILIASRESLQPLLKRLGGRLQTGPEPLWLVPS